MATVEDQVTIADKEVNDLCIGLLCVVMSSGYQAAALVACV